MGRKGDLSKQDRRLAEKEAKLKDQLDVVKAKRKIIKIKTKLND